VPKRIYNVVEYDTYAEIPATGSEGLIHCIEDGKVYCREGDGSLHEPANTGGESEHDHDSDYAAVDHSHVHNHVHDHDSDYAAVHEHPYAADNHTHPGGSEAFPVGTVFLSVVSTSPATLLGYGTWSQIAGGRMLVGQTGSDADFDVAEETGGAKTHTLTTAEMPVHTHVQDAHSHLTQRYPTATGASSGFTIDTSMSGTLANNTLPTATTTAVNQNAGSGSAHNNMPPYLVVYMWKRTA
jgi:hypothetical protein